jgi:hypothetical protein
MRPHLVSPWPDDGSNMYVDGVPVVNNGGLHGPIKKRGSIRLSRGFHFLMVDFFDGVYGATLDITYSVGLGGGGCWSRLVFWINQ